MRLTRPAAAPDGSFFEDLVPGRLLEAPETTLTHGVAAVYQSLIGDVAPLFSSQVLSSAVAGEGNLLANPSLVAQISIGHSTIATAQVVANLYYRGLTLPNPCRLGDTLTTSVRVLGREWATVRPDRPPRGKVLLRVRTVDQAERAVAEYERCALVRARGPHGTVEPEPIPAPEPAPPLPREQLGWDSAGKLPSFRSDGWALGTIRRDPAKEPLTNQMALVRLTQNRALAHRDPAYGQDGRALAYGGHVVALAQASLSRLMPSFVTVLGWNGCDHVGPSFEGDLLEFEATPTGWHPDAPDRVLEVRVDGHATAAGEAARRHVLRWDPIVLVAC